MNKKAVLLWFYRVTSLLLAVSYLLVIITLGRLGILPGLYFLIFIGITAPFIVWLALNIFRQDTPAKKRKIFTGLAIIISIISLYAFTTLYATTSFLAGLGQSAVSYESYSIVAKKERHLSLVSAKKAAFIAGDVNEEAVHAEAKKITNAEQASVDALTSMTAGLNGSTVDLGVVRDAQLELIKDSDAKFYEALEVLATFKVRLDSPRVASTVDVTKPFILYISGIDTYGQVATTARSDVNMLVVVNPREHKVLLVNTPRDYYVQLYGTSGVRDKLTHAGIYGIDVSVKTMENLYGVPIDSYARVNFSSLISMVDTFGGITVYSDYAFKSFTKGYNTLNGAQALEFSRERYSFAEGDRARGKNQQRVIEAIIQKLNSPAILTQYSSLLSVLGSSLETNMRGDKVAALANKQLQSLQSWSSESISVDGTGKMAPTYSMGATSLYVMEPDTASLLTAKQKISQYLSE